MKKIIVTLLIWLVPAFLLAQAPFPFHSHYIGTSTHNINLTLTTSDTIPLTAYGTIYSFSIDATILQPNESSFVRIVLEDIDGHNYLVAESDRFRNDTTTVELEDYCEETAKLSGIVPVSLKCYINNASLTLQSAQTSNAPVASSPNISNDSIKRLQVQNIVDRINTYNIRHGKLWRADINQVALKNYSDKIISNAAREEDDAYTANIVYYSGGIYEMGEMTDSIADEMTDSTDCALYSFSWEDWLTPVKDQGNANYCSAFAGCSMLEATSKLYYNKIDWDLDLSEASIIKGCSLDIKKGGYITDVLTYMRDTGVIDEETMPYSDVPCGEIPDPTGEENERIFTMGSFSIFPADSAINTMKWNLIKNGPAVSGYCSGTSGHAMALFGYGHIAAGDEYRYFSNEIYNLLHVNDSSEYIGRLYWRFKNSWGRSHSYVNICFNNYKYMLMMSSINISHQYLSIISKNYKWYDRKCSDRDGDGYMFTGLSRRIPYYPTWAPEETDGDDLDSLRGPMDENGCYMELSPNRKKYVYIENDTVLHTDSTINKHHVIWYGGKATISQNITFEDDTQLIVDKGSTLIVDGATLSNVTLRPQKGSQIIIKNNGKIIMQSGKSLDVPIDAKLEMNCGAIQIDS